MSCGAKLLDMWSFCSTELFTPQIMSATNIMYVQHDMRWSPWLVQKSSAQCIVVELRCKMVTNPWSVQKSPAQCSVVKARYKTVTMVSV